MIPSQPLYYLALALLMGMFILCWTKQKLLSRFLSVSKITMAEIIAVCSLATIGAIAVYFNMIIGPTHYAYTDAGSDTIQQYIPFYLDLIQQVRDGTFSWWNFNYGLGVSMFKCQSWIFDPFNIILIPGCLAFGDSALPTVLLGIHIFKIFLCAIIFDIFLQFYCARPLSRIIGATVFAFNGFLMLWGSHYWFGNACLACVLVLLCIEYCLKGSSPKRLFALAMTVAVVLIWSVYVGFVVLVFAAAYGLVRAALFNETVAGYFRNILPILIAAIAGCFISCIALIPTAHMLLVDSTRITQGTPVLDRAIASLGSFTPPNVLFVELTRFLSTNLVATGYDQYPIMNYYETIQISCSCAVFLFFFLYLQWLVKRASRKLKIVSAFPIAFALFYIINDFIPQLFNAFAGLAFRSSYVVIVLLCIMVAFSLDEIVIPRRVSLPSLLFGFSISFVLIMAAAFYATHYARRVLLVMSILLIACAICIMLYQTKAWRKALAVALSAVIGSVLFDAYITVNLRGVSNDESFPVSALSGKNLDTEEALSFVKANDSSLFRIEKTYADWTQYEDSFVQNYCGASIYCSAPSSGIQKFNNIVWPETLPSGESYQAITINPNHPGALSFLGVRYILSRSELDYPWLSLFSEEAGIYIYKNTCTNSIARLYTSYISETDHAALLADKRDAIWENALVVADQTYREHLNFQDNSAESKNDVIDLKRSVGSTLVGTAHTTKAGIAAISIPYAAGWTISVDGEPVDIQRVNYGFIGFELNAGNHDIRATYEPYGWKLGAILSFVGFIVLLIPVFMIRRQKPESQSSFSKKKQTGMHQDGSKRTFAKHSDRG